MKKFLAVILALALCLPLTACGASDGDSPGKHKAVGVCLNGLDDDSTAAYRDALQKILEDKGFTVTVADSGGSQASQDEQIGSLISQGADALIICPADVTAADEIIKQVKKAGVPVVLINREPTAEQLAVYDRLVYVGRSARQSGAMQGELILETASGGDLNGDGVIKYIMIQGNPEDVETQYRTAFSVKVLTDAGMQVEQLNLTQGNWDRGLARELTAADLAQFGDEIEVIFCNDDNMALGALEAVQQAGRRVNEDLYLVGTGSLDEALREVQAGNLTGTVLNDLDAQASAAAEQVEALLSGAVFALGEQSVYVDYVKVTPDNAGDFLD